MVGEAEEEERELKLGLYEVMVKLKRKGKSLEVVVYPKVDRMYVSLAHCLHFSYNQLRDLKRQE